VALRAENDEITRQFFDPEFIVYEDPGMPYGGILHGPDAFIMLRRKVRKFWNLAFIAKCIEPNGDKLVAVFKATGVPGSAVDGLETVVAVVWTFRDDKAVEARVLYYDTPRLSLALAQG
jgi:ketosteroid isomerase-like protein